MPGRTISNKFLDEAYEGKRRPSACKYNCIKSCNPKTTTYCIADALLAAYKGNMENGFAFTGANTGRIGKMSTVKKIFTELKNEYLQAKKGNS